jgi:hypothetical protein
VKFWIAPLSWHRRAGEESRGGKPAALKATHRGKDPGIIRLIFPDAPNADDDSLEEISWGEFFRKFDEADLALLYQDRTSDGKISLFNKLDQPGNGRGARTRRQQGATPSPRANQQVNQRVRHHPRTRG